VDDLLRSFLKDDAVKDNKDNKDNPDNEVDDLLRSYLADPKREPK
jgi:hypothetical protein